jgi:hypothetical protein
MSDKQQKDQEQEGHVPGCDDFRCPVQQFEEDDDDPYISHVIVMKSGEVFYANRSIELEAQLPDGEIEILIAIDAMDFPEEGDRSIITAVKKNVDYTQELYNKESWNALMRASFCSKCEQMAKYNTHTGMFG